MTGSLLVSELEGPKVEVGGRRDWIACRLGEKWRVTMISELRLQLLCPCASPLARVKDLHLGELTVNLENLREENGYGGGRVLEE